MKLEEVATETLRSAHSELTFVCPACKTASRVEPPFNVTAFACPACAKRVHPFIRYGHQVVDLVQLRGLIGALYVDPALARDVLEYLRTPEYRAVALESQIPRAVVASHAVVALTRNSERGIPWLSIPIGAIFPLMTAAAPLMAWHWSRYREREEAIGFVSRFCSSTNFDPSAIPSVHGMKTSVSVLERLASPSLSPRVLFEKPIDSIAALGSLESRWSIVIDTAKRKVDSSAAPSPLDLSAFRQKLAHRVASVVAEPGEVLARVRDLVLVRGRLMPSHPFVDNGRPLQDLSESAISNRLQDLRAKSDVEVYSVVEMHDFRDGNIIRGCITTDRAGSYLTVRWFTYAFTPAYPGAVFLGRVIDPDEVLAAREEREVRAEASGWLAGTLTAIPDWLPVWLFGIPIMGGIWIALTTPLGLGLGFGTVSGRIAYVLVMGSLALLNRWSRRRPFPVGVLEERELSGTQRRERRIDSAVEAVKRQLGRWSYGALAAVGVRFRAMSKPDRLSQQRGDFLVYALNRAVQDAIILEAESAGIDMSEFREGIAQFNNYGVMSNTGVVAGTIAGPVSVGERAVATQQIGPGTQQRVAEGKTRGVK